MSVVIHNFFISFVMHYLEQYVSMIFFCYYCRLLTFNLIHLASTKNVKNLFFLMFMSRGKTKLKPASLQESRFIR